LAVPYLRVILPGIMLVLGFVGLVELTSFLTIGAAQGKVLIVFGHKIDVHAASPWAFAAVLLVGGAFWLRLEVRLFQRVWEGIMFELKPQRSVA
jgi:branched-chain amino acid transport system permease protein